MNAAAPVSESPEPQPSTPQAPPSPAPAAPASEPLALGRADLAVLGGLFLFFLAARGAVFPIAENYYGDAVVRSEIAERWAASPQLLRSFKDGIYQFGPLHFYYMGAILEVWPSREHATRFASLLAGLLLVLPVYRLGRRLFSKEAAIAAALAMGAWGLHIQASTTAASEAFFLTLFFFGLDYLFQGIEEGRVGPLAKSALFVNLCCMTRYDGWMYVGIFPLVVAFSGKDRIAAMTRGVLMLGMCVPFPLWWMQQSEKATGDALYAIRYIEQFHAAWVHDSVAWLGNAGFRVYALGFWPGTVLASASLLVGVFAVAGMVRAFVRKERRGLALIAVLPAAYYTFRAAVLVDFSPLARFAMAQVAISLMFVKDGFDWICGRLPGKGRVAVAGLAGAVAVATSVGLGVFTAHASGKWEETVRPISPVSTIPVDQKAAATYLKQNVMADEGAVIDESPQYVDINVAFFSGIPETRLSRLRWEDFPKQMAKNPNSPWIFAVSGGALSKQGVAVGDEVIEWRGGRYQRVAQPSETMFVYRKI